jgi:hypothetical protein
MRACLLFVIGFVVTGCWTTPERNWPFPEVDAPDEATVLRIIEERSRPPKSAYAEIAMSFESKERSGVVDTVVQMVPGSGLRMTAIKDVFVATRPIFDILVRANRFELHLWPEDGPAERHAGRLEELAGIHDALFAFAVLRERLFAPGRGFGRGERVVRIDDDRVLIDDHGDEEFSVRWTLDSRTLGVERVDIWSPRRSKKVSVVFTSYRDVDGRFVPEAFRIEDGEKRFSVEGVLRDLELDLDPVELDFELLPFEDEEGQS